MTFILARRVTGGATAEAWLAGLAFAWAPLMVARSTGHFSLVAAAPLPAFLWCLHRLDRSERLRDSVLAGAVVAWAAFCDAYYAVYCLMIGTLYVTSRVLRFEWRPEWRQGPGRWMLDLCILLAAGMVAGLMLGRGGRVELLGVPVSVRGLYTPMFVLTVLVLARVLITLRPHIARVTLPDPRAIGAVRRRRHHRRGGAVAGALRRVAADARRLAGCRRRSTGAAVRRGWTCSRSSSRTPRTRWSTWLAGSAQLAAPTVFVEHTASLSLVALAVVVFGAWRLGLRPAGWVTLTVVFGLLALGPFVHRRRRQHVCPRSVGAAALRAGRSAWRARPTRFAIVAALGLTMLFALALAECGRRWPHRRRQVLAVTAVALLVELWPAPRPLYSAAISPVYDLVRADPRDVRILELPFGVRDGTSSEGDFSARYQFNQTRHGKPLMGGYLSRVSARRVREVKETPMLSALLALSEDRTLPPADLEGLRHGAPAFVDTARLGWVVVHPSRTPRALHDFVLQALALEFVASDEDILLYRPGVGTLGPAPAVARTARRRNRGVR